MSGNGAATGMMQIIIQTLQQALILWVQEAGKSGCAVVAAGSTIRLIAAPPAGAGTPRTTGTATWASGWLTPASREKFGRRLPARKSLAGWAENPLKPLQRNVGARWNNLKNRVYLPENFLP